MLLDMSTQVFYMLPNYVSFAAIVLDPPLKGDFTPFRWMDMYGAPRLELVRMLSFCSEL